ncbi:amino acid permease-domain-containing protein [Mucor mucedo]|uniref:amino acid permease-domain-containing protein n=1 Tax=Mucor mucedo TaxID=29922 RepID=UPI00221F0B5A|nr:amino acid permease-domain-containing protein [Mucor mucedo]KAI7866301.1 amino acid permease-domain-containing protein [Mucor mucedo]
MVGIFSRGAGLAQGATVFGSNIIYAIGGPSYTNNWGARGFAGFAGLSGRFSDGPDLSENFSFDGTLKNPGSYASAIYYVIYAYGGCYSAYLAVLPLSVIRASNLTVAANLFNTAFGGIFGSRVLPVLVGSSSFGFVGVVFYSGSRVVLEASRQGFLPYDRFFSKVHPKLHTPIYSLVLLYVIALIFLLAPPPGSAFQFIVAFTGYGNYFFSAMSVIGLLILRRTQPNIKRPLKVPVVVAIFFIIICLYTLVFVFVPPETKPNGYPYWRKFY